MASVGAVTTATSVFASELAHVTRCLWCAVVDMRRLQGGLVRVIKEIHPGQTPCARCGHRSNDHRLEAYLNVAPSDPTAQFRCVISPRWNGSPSCVCPDFVAPRDLR